MINVHALRISLFLISVMILKPIHKTQTLNKLNRVCVHVRSERERKGHVRGSTKTFLTTQIQSLVPARNSGKFLICCLQSMLNINIRTILADLAVIC